MNDTVTLFLSIGEPYAAGLFEVPERGYFYRHCCGYARWFRTLKPALYEGELLYPCGTKFWSESHAVMPQYAQTWQVDFPSLEKKSPEAAELLRPFWEESHSPGGWLHGTPNYPRIIREGLSSYRTRILARPEGEEFREGLLLLIDAMEDYVKRSVSYLKSVNAPKKLTDALTRVPFAPAETLYEGLVGWNMIFYLDGCDNLGRIDSGLGHLYNGEDMTEVIAQMFRNIDAVGMWSCTIGSPCNELTRQALRAIKGRRRPLLEVLVNEDTPEDIWSLASAALVGGASNPAFYNDNAIRSMIRERFPDMPEQDCRRFVGCGCTETNLEGITRAGGTDDNINLTLILERVMYDSLPSCKTFEEFLDILCEETVRETNELLDRLTDRYFYMARCLPQPTRTLFVDDCIDKGLDYNAGGARYTWTMNSDSGIINVIDSLAAIQKLVYEDKRYTAEEFLSLLRTEDASFYAELAGCPCFGIDDERTDALGAEYVGRIYSVYRARKSVGFIDAFTLTEHQFLRHDGEGRRVGPTPDGRHAHEPTCDSIAALHGKARKGPTAMLRSAAKLPQHLAEGISVLNLTVTKRTVSNPAVLQSLVRGYFDLGGMQIQVTATSKDELEDAYHHPEKHEDFLVRVGGYSEYYNRLSEPLRKLIYERDIHEA